MINQIKGEGSVLDYKKLNNLKISIIIKKRLNMKNKYLKQIVFVFSIFYYNVSFSQTICDSLKTENIEAKYVNKEISMLTFLHKVIQIAKFGELKTPTPNKLFFTFLINKFGVLELIEVMSDSEVVDIKNIREVNDFLKLNNSWIPAKDEQGNSIDSCIKLPVYIEMN